jgi:hypothetical protein
MKFDPQTHHRRSIRLKNYAYSQPGVYFITFVTKDRASLFGEITDEMMQLNVLGEIIALPGCAYLNFFHCAMMNG